ncbi:H(+)-transporting ATPase [Lactonifactor longoviformis]|uniref:TrkH family potassium uptake protein n=1 Tax=Lactonifactor TaxID=420345 RepID=UPI0012AF0245|nr:MULTISPECIES: potassium transporter TrkG [Lactonifactor]MCB5714320.1 H(+)-transporting ATPase [Lactonifactor longoviformis]MCB5718275.1 H(+)-transporting ATPase [Lactonifactor longoviformis]MCQ4671887.1 H(+)-transporting ATPase [Lactonifactor longoviformis]MSA02409.1 H(+)-transporting ATPase [Lactonifactor sp. BIOML-A5]MSA08850.1 H(+)-transporting ATPase [Lactonifactor sp. BIOML-A4]
MELLKRQSPGRLIVLGFAGVILLGTFLLMMPVSVREGQQVSFINALFTSTSAVCVTGLIAIDTADHFTVFGRTIVALLIQIGGLGVTSVGVGLILLTGKRVGMKGRLMVKEAMNVGSLKGMVRLVKAVLLMTLCFEAAGAALSFLVFAQDYPPLQALGISVFHAVAAFNNSGFDILGGLRNLIPYQNDILLNLTTSGLIIFGGLGFLVILDIGRKRSFKKLCLHSKVVVTMSVILLAAGTLLLKATEDISWLGAFFQSVSARTAGFSSYPIGEFTNAGLFVLIILMFIGASPGSTGGGIKTSTFFALVQATKSAATNQHCSAFHRKLPYEVLSKAFIITFLSMLVVCAGTFLLCILEPEYTFVQLLFEITSAFGTVGLSTGITPELGDAGKYIVILTMFIGRLGPLTIASIWSFRPAAAARYSEESITIG